ncbi:hypothetical protein [Tateyamaria sp. SN6-1]|uniref:hypothetical protein n=1 Tax=Tateyamaria sp. SN6-1 TaxID=3092148 RepID=UPI0039F51824
MHLIYVFLLSVWCVVPGAGHAQSDDAVDVTFQLSGMARATRCGNIAEARPCVITTNADTGNCRVRFIEIVAQYTVTYSGLGRKDSATRSQAWTGNACQPSFSHNASDDVRGGDTAIRYTYRLSNGQTGTFDRTITILGKNPTPAQVRAEIGQPVYEAAVFRLNAFEQFAADGAPKTSNRFGGFGVGDIVAAGVPDLWNWKSNIAARKAILDAAWAEAAAFPATMRAAGYAVPDFTDAQLARQALLSLRGRSYHRPAATGGWEVAAPATNFADIVMAIAADVAAGNPPAGW